MDKLMQMSDEQAPSPSDNNMQVVLYQDKQQSKELLFSMFVKQQMSQMLLSNEKLNKSQILKVRKMFDELPREKQSEYQELMDEIVMMEIDE